MISLVSFLGLIAYVSATTYLSGAETGKATYYTGEVTAGACGYEQGIPTSAFPYGKWLACGSTKFNDGYGCGACYEITCTGSPSEGCTCDEAHPTITLPCLDKCPSCDSTHLDLIQSAYNYISSDSCGVITTSVKQVACEWGRNLQIRAKAGTSEYWYGMHLDYVGGYGTVQTIYLKSSGDSTYQTTCTKANGPSYWICSGGTPRTAPASLKIVDSSGEVITCDSCITSFAGGATFDFGTNFQSSGSSVTTTTTTTSTTTTTTSSGGGGGSDSGCPDSYTLTIVSGSTQWWLSILPGQDECIEYIQIKDQSRGTDWTLYALHQYGYYIFTDGPYVGPFDFKIVTSDGRTGIAEGVMDSLTGGAYGTVYISSSFTEDENKNGLKPGAIIGIVLAILVCITCIVVGVMYYKRRPKKEVTFKEDTENTTDNVKETPSSNDHAEQNVDKDEIEVEMEVETA